MSQKPRIALIGAGNMGSLHARVVSQSEHAELVYLIDPREEIGRGLASKHNAKWLPEIPDLRDVDAVIVAAATEAHYSLAMQVLESETALLIEKPVADSLLRTEEILEVAERKDLPFMCGLLERFNPAVMTARSLVQEPKHIVATRHSPYAPRIRTGVSWDLLVHDVDLVIQLMNDEPIQVESHLGFFHPDSLSGAEDVVEAILSFEKGGISRVSASRIGQRKIRKLSIYEEERLIEVDLLRRAVTIYRNVSEKAVDEGLGYRQQTVIEIPEIANNREPLSAQFEHFIDVLNGKADAATERRSIAPSHRAIDLITRKRPTGKDM